MFLSLAEINFPKDLVMKALMSIMVVVMCDNELMMVNGDGSGGGDADGHGDDGDGEAVMMKNEIVGQSPGERAGCDKRLNVPQFVTR